VGRYRNGRPTSEAELTERHLERLVARAREGDARAFGRLYDAYADRVYGFVRARMTSAHDAEDVTATVFMKAWEAIASYDDRGIPFAAWLFRIARNAVIDEYRRSARGPVLSEAEGAVDVTEGSDVDTVVLERAEAGRVRAAIGRLTEEQAAVLVLRFWWDLSLRDTADALGKNENAVKALQHRAMRSLARVLEEDGSDGD
jgi:RNA polymerase sigma-70 factor (ECF subfamily)